MNRVILTGRITKDPELRHSPTGTAYCSFSLAVNRQMPNAQGERVADFINCVVFNKQAENLSRFIKKGGLIGVDGRLQQRTYQSNTGENRTTFDVVCDSIDFLAPKGSNSGDNNDFSSYEPSFSQVPQSESFDQTIPEQPVKPFNTPSNNREVSNDKPESSNNSGSYSDDDFNFF